MLAVMSADEEKCAANGGVLPEHFQRIIEIGILDGENRAAEMGEGIFEGLHGFGFVGGAGVDGFRVDAGKAKTVQALDRKSTRLNSSHQIISYAVFCLKKKTNQ